MKKQPVERIVFATGNQDKMGEIRQILSFGDIQVLSMGEAGIDVEVDENGKSFEENSLIKARSVWEAAHGIVLADDSGLEIDALGGEPGIYSARYMGHDSSYHVKNMNLIERLEGVPDERRSARFVCAVSAVFPDGSSKTVRGTMEGRIGYEEKGENGFGYDPIFFLEEYQMTSAQISAELKNSLSHRGKALRLISREIEEYIKNNDKADDR